jgi:formamidopyrimidine-DNA glycosylase
MPELPEVETTMRGVSPHITGQTIAKVIVRQPKLRWPVPSALAKAAKGQVIASVKRRAKYLLRVSQRPYYYSLRHEWKLANYPS